LDHLLLKWKILKMMVDKKSDEILLNLKEILK